MDMKRKNEEFCGCAPMPLQIVFPAENDTVRSLDTVFGWSAPGALVKIYIDGEITARCRADCCGHWLAAVSSLPGEGTHRLCASSGCLCGKFCVNFTVSQRAEPLPSPVISYPVGKIPESAPLIHGIAVPDTKVRVCIDNTVCGETVSGSDGVYSWQYPDTLTEGYHVVTAAVISAEGIRSNTAYQVFQSEGYSEFKVMIEDAHEGSHFRTVALDLRITSTVYPVTLNYLFLPPGSPAPDAEQILSYTGPGLADGTAARGSVEITAGGHRMVEVTGRENAPADALGVVDNRRYDVYILAQAAEEQTPVLSAFRVLAMPFAGGLGVSGNPYLISELSIEQIHQIYPDLAADRSPLGVDDTARMLRNIDNAQALYESSGGEHGIRNSMVLDYHLNTPMNLSGYTDAEAGLGWRPLGYQGKDLEPRYFSGRLTGEGEASPIVGLTIIREALRRIEGLFAAGSDGEFQGITIVDSVIRLSASDDPDQSNDTDVGLLVTHMDGGSLKDITIRRAEIAVPDTETFYLSSTIGGITAVASNFLAGEHLLADDIHIRHRITFGEYGPVGGMFGYISSSGYGEGFAGTVLDTIAIQDSTIDAQGYVGGIAGSMDGLRIMRGVTCQRCTISVRGEAAGLTSDLHLNLPDVLLEDLSCADNSIQCEEKALGWYSGGMFGIISIDEDGAVLRSAQVTNCTLKGVSQIGGFAGELVPRADSLIEDCHVNGTQITAEGSIMGGFLGHLFISYVDLQERRGIIRNCTVRALTPMKGQQMAGGFVGQCSVNSRNTVPYEISFDNCSVRADLQCTGEQVGGFAGLCNIGTFTGCRSEGLAEGTALTGGFAGELSLQQQDYTLYVTQCAAGVDIRQTGSEQTGGFGGFAGRADSLEISECLATGQVAADSQNSGAFIGEIRGGAVTSDCYAAGELKSSQGAAGGVFGGSQGGVAKRCYYQGSLQGGVDTGGLCGRCDKGTTAIEGCLVLSPEISGSTPTGRVVGEGNGNASLQANYAVTTNVLQDGQLKEIDSNPAGVDGETISGEQIVSTLQRIGWSDSVWNFYGVTGEYGPKLYNTPE